MRLSLTPTVAERYDRDPMFRVLVDTLYLQIQQARYTPTEIREAAMLAQIRFEQRTLRPMIIPLRCEDEPYHREDPTYPPSL